MEEKNDNYIVYNGKVMDYSEEVDFSLYRDIIGEEELEKSFGVEHIYKGVEFPNTPIKIEKLKKEIEKLETQGLNYVSIDYHCDHNEYEFYGIDVHKASEEEILEFEESEKRELEKKYEELKKAVEHYNSEMDKIKKQIEK